MVCDSRAMKAIMAKGYSITQVHRHPAQRSEVCGAGDAQARGRCPLRPPAFGKTVTAAALIARRKVSTLVLVHRTDLLRQWHERLTGFLEMSKGGLGVIGGGKKKPSGEIDIAPSCSPCHAGRI